jgi:monofunctional biosynthetic peptidoglycan transglycosylase
MVAKKRKKIGKSAKAKSRRTRWPRRIALAALVFVVASFLVVLPLRWFDPETTAFMLQDESGRQPLLHKWVDWEQLGKTAALAVVASEDQRFADHHGIDFTAIQKSIDEQDQRGYVRGASTISQQTVKNIFLWSGRSLFRKGIEAWLTIVIEIGLPKQRILEIYLNIVELGPGIYGVAAASRYFFGKSPSALTDREAALLAAVLPSPRRYDAGNPSDFVRERSDWIVTQIERLRREAWITRISR